MTPRRIVLEDLTTAVRAGSAERLRESLTAVVVEGQSEWRRDWRDLLMALAPYYAGALRLRLDPAEFFSQVAEAAPDDLADHVRSFGRREDVSPEAFGYFVVDTPEGPRYEVEGMTDEELERLLDPPR